MGYRLLIDARTSIHETSVSEMEISRKAREPLSILFWHEIK